MSIPKWKLENDLCRCCHSEGPYVNLAEPRIVDGEIEVYSEMLQECFNIFIAPVSGALNEITYSICENCSNKLRDALSFKQQVLECEKKFENMHSKNCIIVSESIPRVKIEIDISDDEAPEEAEVKVQLDPMADDDDDDGLEDSGNDFLFPEDPDSNSDEDMEIPEKEKQKTPKKTAKTTKKPAKSVQSKNATKLDKSKPKAKKKKESTADEEDEKEDEKKDGEKKAPVKNGRKCFKLRDDDYTLEEDGLLKCTKCDLKFNRMVPLRKHVKKTHYPKYTCQYCSTGFMLNSLYMTHKLEQHNVDDRYHCNACKNVFISIRALRNHKNSFHMLGVKTKCDKCDYETYIPQNLKKHMILHTTTVKKHRCKFCNKSFLRRNTQMMHEKIHTGVKNKVCTLCKEAFVQKASLNYHMTKYHPEATF